MARSFFTMLLDDLTDPSNGISTAERREFNAAHDRADHAIDIAESRSRELAGEVGELRRQLAEQAAQIKTLSAAVTVLAAVLRDNGVVDADILEARFEAALLNAEEAALAKATAARAVAQDRKAHGMVAKETCTKCGAIVPANLTVMTEQGTVCDRCHAGA